MTSDDFSELHLETVIGQLSKAAKGRDAPDKFRDVLRQYRADAVAERDERIAELELQCQRWEATLVPLQEQADDANAELQSCRARIAAVEKLAVYWYNMDRWTASRELAKELRKALADSGEGATASSELPER